MEDTFLSDLMASNRTGLAHSMHESVTKQLKKENETNTPQRETKRLQTMISAAQAHKDEAEKELKLDEIEVMALENKMRTALYLGFKRKEDLLILDDALTAKFDDKISLKR